MLLLTRRAAAAKRRGAMPGSRFFPVLVEAVTGAERELGTDPPVASGLVPSRPAGFFLAPVYVSAETHYINLDEIRDRRRLGNSWRLPAIEYVANKFHNSLRFRLGDTLPYDPIDAIERCGFSVEMYETLGHFIGDGGRVEAAGFIDGNNRIVGYSRSFSRPVRNFTLAHELGHLVLHRPMSQHRDRPVDGGNNFARRSPIEREADEFAASFLMPEQLLREHFYLRFRTDRFELNEATAFALSRANLCDVLTKWQSRRDGARMLAKATHFNGNFVEPLFRQFGVSPGAMAIRLEKLDLL